MERDRIKELTDATDVLTRLAEIKLDVIKRYEPSPEQLIWHERVVWAIGVAVASMLTVAQIFGGSDVSGDNVQASECPTAP